MVAIISTAHEEGTGAYRVLDYFLRARPEAATDVMVVTPPDSLVGRTVRELGTPVVALPTARDAAVANWRALGPICRELRNRDIRLVHAWHSRGFDLAWALGRRLRVPATATLHDHPANRAHGTVRRAIMVRSAAHMVRLAAVSRALAEAWRARCRTPAEVVPNGIPDLSVPPRKTSDRVVIGFAGLHAEMKGLRVVLDWARALDGEPAQWHFYGTASPAALASIRPLQGPTVVMRGHQTPATIMRELDVLVHPSLEFDSLPTTLIEAACAGIPVVASDIGGAREIVTDGETGALFAPENPAAGLDALRRLVRDAGRRRAMGEAARRQFERAFRIERMVAGYDRFWADAMTPGSRGAGT